MMPRSASAGVGCGLRRDGPRLVKGVTTASIGLWVLFSTTIQAECTQCQACSVSCHVSSATGQSGQQAAQPVGSAASG